jgi:hypothetical protein
VAVGPTPLQPGLLSSTAGFCEGRLAPNSIYAVLHRECGALFPDEMFPDLFAEDGRRPVPPMIVAVVMVLQRPEGLSDREAVDRFAFDAHWKYAAGGLDFDHPAFVHTVLVDMRARLAASVRPDRIFERTGGLFRERLRRLPACGPVHDRQERTRHHYLPARGAPCPGPGTQHRPRLAGRLPGHPAQGRTQDRPLDAAATWRTPRPRAWPGQDRRGLLPARRRRGLRRGLVSSPP